MEKKTFKSDVKDMMKIIINSLYSNKEIFLRELISNASDALDKLKLKSLTGESVIKDELCIEIKANRESRTIVISDNGIGMNHDELISNLGTIARSGTRQFLSSLSGSGKSDSSLIGQFGVGFYSAFLVANKVEVISKAYGDDKAYKWVSDGIEKYTIDDASRDYCGTDVILYLKEECEYFATDSLLKSITLRYSNHIVYPIYFVKENPEKKDDNSNVVDVPVRERINNSKALWRRPKTELTEDDYRNFYKDNFNSVHKPLCHIHINAEGAFNYSVLLYAPDASLIPNRVMEGYNYIQGNSRIKLYSNRVFISDNTLELLPSFLRFLVGFIESDDIPLNVSREMIQDSFQLRSLTDSIVKKILSEFENISKNDDEKYQEFFKYFGSYLKEGNIQSNPYASTLTKLMRYKCSFSDKYISLDEYRARMKEGQKKIYAIISSDYELAKKHPLVKSYTDRGYDVIFLLSNLDEISLFANRMSNPNEDSPFLLINKSSALHEKEDEKKQSEDDKKLSEKISKALGEEVQDVVISNRLSDISSQLIVQDNDLSYRLKSFYNMNFDDENYTQYSPILEVNPNDDIVKSIKESDDEEYIKNASCFIFADAALRDSHIPNDPVEISERMRKYISSKK